MYKSSLPMVQSVCPMDGLSKRKRSLCRPQFQCKPYSNRNVRARQTKRKHLKIRQPILLTVKETIERRRRYQGKNRLHTGISVWPRCFIFVVQCHRRDWCIVFNSGITLTFRCTRLYCKLRHSAANVAGLFVSCCSSQATCPRPIDNIRAVAQS